MLKSSRVALGGRETAIVLDPLATMLQRSVIDRIMNCCNLVRF